MAKCKNIDNTTHIFKDSTSKIDYNWMGKYNNCLTNLKIIEEYPYSKSKFILLTHFPISKYKLTSWEGYHSNKDGLVLICNDINSAESK